MDMANNKLLILKKIIMTNENITINFKEKSLMVIATLLAQIKYELVADLVMEIRDKATSVTDPDADVAITININRLPFIIELLGQQKEFEYADNNKTLKDALVAKVNELSQSQLPEELEQAEFLGSYLLYMSDKIDEIMNLRANQGRVLIGKERI